LVVFFLLFFFVCFLTLWPGEARHLHHLGDAAGGTGYEKELW
jgi:hypothetical protein